MNSHQAAATVLLATATLAAAVRAQAQPPRLVKDLNTSSDGSGAYIQAEAGGYAFMYGSEPDHGAELWKTDGTAEGTTLVKDVWPGPTSSETFHMAAVGDLIFFAPDTEEYGRELWKSDGTEAGTVLVKDILPGPPAGFPEDFMAVGDTLFFVARDDNFTRELWKSDGTEVGTVMVKKIGPPDQFGGADPRWLTRSGDNLFFEADDGVHGAELWISDGTEVGTLIVKDINPGRRGSILSDLYDWDGTLYFAAEDPEHGQELWKSDGTEAGTVLVADIFPGERTSFPGGFAAVGDTLFFVAEDEEHGAELRTTDGTEAGTTLVLDMRPGDESGGGSAITDVNGTAFFFAVDPERENETFDPVWELWTSDGTEAGTSKVRDVAPGSIGFVDDEALAFNGRLIFSGEDTESGIELWISDGTEAGTGLLRDIFPGPTDSLPLALTELDGRILFSAEDDVFGRELWTTDGTAGGTELVADINSKGTMGSDAATIVELDGIVYFSADDRETGRELWRSDGTRAGTYLVRDINPTGDGFERYGTEIVAAGDRLFFLSDDGVHGTEAWTSDGTRKGTRMLRELVPGDDSDPRFSVRLFALTGTERYAYFLQFESQRCILWRTDGTADGTIELLREDGCLYPVASMGPFLFLTDGSGLWRSNGSPQGTFQILEGLNFTGFKGFIDGQFAALDDVLIFSPGSNSPNREVWRTDGTRAGTFRIKDIAPGSETSGSRFFVAAADLVFFQADDGSNGIELWQTDGTEVGTEMVADLASGRASSNPVPLADVQDELFFAIANNSDPHGLNGLWKTRGAGSGTEFISPRARPVFEEVAVIGNTLYFPWRDFPTVTGDELWQTDGTAKGTRLVADLLPGFRGSDPDNLTAAGSSLFFAANSRRFGRELWVVGPDRGANLPGTVTPLRDLDGLGSEDVAILRRELVIRDAASGETILASGFGSGPDWEGIDLEPFPDTNGNGSAEIAILARKRRRARIFVHDALTGDLLAKVSVPHKRHPLDLEVLPAENGGSPRLAVLSRRSRGRAWVMIRSLDGTGDDEFSIPRELSALDLEVAPPKERGESGHLAVLGASGPKQAPRLVVLDSRSGKVLATRTLPARLRPLDLEIVRSNRQAPFHAAVLLEKRKNGAARVLTLDLATGESVRQTRYDKRYRALDLEAARSADGSPRAAVALLQEHRLDGKVRVVTRDAFTGRELGTAAFPEMLVPIDLATVRDIDHSGSFEVLILGEAECVDAGPATVLRDAESGERLGCEPLP